jgi:hypothetical protein
VRGADDENYAESHAGAVKGLMNIFSFGNAGIRFHAESSVLMNLREMKKPLKLRTTTFFGQNN